MERYQTIAVPKDSSALVDLFVNLFVLIGLVGSSLVPHRFVDARSMLIICDEDKAKIMPGDWSSCHSKMFPAM